MQSRVSEHHGQLGSKINACRKLSSIEHEASRVIDRAGQAEHPQFSCLACLNRDLAMRRLLVGQQSNRWAELGAGCQRLKPVVGYPAMGRRKPSF